MIGTIRSSTTYNTVTTDATTTDCSSCSVVGSTACRNCSNNPNTIDEEYFTYSLVEIPPEPDIREKSKNPLDKIKQKKNFKAIQDMHRRRK